MKLEVAGSPSAPGFVQSTGAAESRYDHAVHVLMMLVVGGGVCFCL